MAVFSARIADALAVSSDLPIRAAAALAFSLALLVLVGWSLDIGLLKSGIPGQSATQPLAAVCFCSCALSLGLSLGSGRASRALLRLCAALPLLIVVVTLWQNALDTDWGLDRLLFSDAVEHEQTGQFLRPGRTAGATLLANAMLASCLLLTAERSRAANRLYVSLGTVGLLFSATVILAYAYSLKALYAMGLYAQVSINSAIILGILFTGVLLRRADLGWMRVLNSDTVGARSGRSLLLWCGSILIVLAAIVQLATANSAYGAQLEATIVTLAAMGLLFASVVAHVERLDAVDSERHGVATRLRHVEQELAHSSRTQDAFLSVLAHELRNPLASLRTGVEIVRLSAGTNPTLAQTAATMGRQMNELVRLVDDLLDISRVATGGLELNRSRVAVNEVVKAATDACRDALSARGHVLVVNLGEDDVAVDGDPRRLIQVVTNVLSHSARYVEAGGRISIATVTEGREGCVRISDTGSGMPAEALEHAFDTFAEVRAQHARSDGGLGVGLALVRTVVQLHGGSVSVQRPSSGTGSSFVIRLPSIGAERRTVQPETPLNAPRQLRIVVADDNTDAAASLATLLRLEGHEVWTAFDGVQAVQVAERFRPDLIFMDMGMPHSDGLEAARTIRAQHWGRGIHLVALTGWGQEMGQDRSVAAGLDRRLLKPVDPRELAAILTAVSEQR